MIPLSVREIIEATDAVVQGALSGTATFEALERDSRRVEPGQLFIAIQGERLDGHAFIHEVAKNGAAAALVSRAWASTNVDPPLPLLVVDEPVAALQRLAAARRAARGDDLIVVGVTGSVGKTSTKEVIATILGSRFSTYRSPGNLNNEIGLPLSLLDVTPEHEIAVLEMGGAYASGELTFLSSIAHPKIGVVTNVFPVHLERMGTIEAIAETKAELVTALPSDGTAILNGDDPRVRAMAERTRARVLTYGLDAENDIRADRITAEALEGTSFRVHIDGETFHVKVPLVGGHAVDLALAGIAVGHTMGMHISEMLVGLKDPSIQVRLLVIPGPRGSRLIDDTYNASTPSVLSALGLLEQLRPQRAIAVLGDMRELGSLAEEEHRIVGRRAGQVTDLVVTYGDLARFIAEEASVLIPDDVDGRPPGVATFALDERQELIDFLRKELREGDVVLLKGSRGLEMEDFVTALRDDAGSLQDLDHATTTSR
ncbi:MAG TPA: UDP-N-acetylmuramoyl-tripeptide--D-alanyl-D-alanine ligase [Thermomicrobiales bacterium]|nr:UDP-N-acetylmuramoyl-tripeptide--D-alanyl-D-alanine ligase [Thermomicrobiales bacterium]